MFHVKHSFAARSRVALSEAPSQSRGLVGFPKARCETNPQASLRSISETIAREAENGGGASSPLQFEPPSRDGPFASPPSRSRVGATLEKTADQPRRTAPAPIPKPPDLPRSGIPALHRSPPRLRHPSLPSPPHCNRKRILASGGFESHAAPGVARQPHRTASGGKPERHAASTHSHARRAPPTTRTPHAPREPARVRRAPSARKPPSPAPSQTPRCRRSAPRGSCRCPACPRR